MYKRLSAPIRVQVEITNKCNQKCLHCYNYWRSGDISPTSELSQKDMDRVSDVLAQNNVFGVVITGGEPLLSYENCVELSSKCQENGLDVSLNTNLTIPEKHKIKTLKEKGVRSILTSILGPNEETHDRITNKPGSFGMLLKGLAASIESSMPITVNMVVTKENKHLVRETAKLVKEMGIKFFCATRAGRPGNCPDFSGLELNRQELMDCLGDLLYAKKELGLEIDTLEPIPLCGITPTNQDPCFSKRKCVAGVTTCTIGSNGETRPCSHLPISYGNILTDDFKGIWQKMTADWAGGKFLPKECKICPMFGECGGGCRMVALGENGINSLCGIDCYADPERAASLKIPAFDRVRASREKEKGAKPFRLLANKMRKEAFGGIVYTPNGASILLDKKGWKIISNLEIGKEYRPSDLDWGSIDHLVFLQKLEKDGAVLLATQG